jgi:hypothetical protein
MVPHCITKQIGSWAGSIDTTICVYVVLVVIRGDWVLLRFSGVLFVVLGFGWNWGLVLDGFLGGTHFHVCFFRKRLFFLQPFLDPFLNPISRFG